MTKTIEATGDGACLFNAVSIGLSIEILSGRLDSQLDTPGYLALLDEFAKHHPQFKPKSWKTLKEWLTYYNNTRDIELILAPVLFNLNQRYQHRLDEEILNELTNLVWKNKANIESGQAWFQLQNVGDFGDALFPKLENLDLKKDRTPLLASLREILKAYQLELTRENVKRFLAEHAKELLSDLNKKISLDPLAFQRGYSCDELKRMADALSITLVENGVDNTTDKKVKIRLENKEEHWNVLCNEEDSSRHLNSRPQQIKMTSLESYRGDKQVAAPVKTISMESHRNEKPVVAPTDQRRSLPRQRDVLLREKIIDNPGLGNCAFYAFAVGLANIIQEEASYNSRAMFDRWIRLDSSIAGQYDAILKLNLENPNRQLLDQLQSSLRIIAYYYQIDELRNVCTFRNGNYNDLIGNSNFVNFAALYYGDPLDTDPRFNPFAGSIAILDEIAKIDRSTVLPGHENDVLVPLFLNLLYGESADPTLITRATEPRMDSPIITAMNNMTQDFFWGTHLDLDYLAEAFEVNLHVLRNDNPIQEFVDIPMQHTVTLINMDNTHWTTQVIKAKLTDSITHQTDVSSKPHDKKKEEGNPLTGKHIQTELVVSQDPMTKPKSKPAKGLAEPSDFSKSKKKSGQKVEDHPPRKKWVTDSVTLRTDVLSKFHGNKKGEGKKSSGNGAQHRKQVVSEDLKKLEQLKRIVANATLDYTTYSENIWFSFFHRHGEAGRVRANHFNSTFSKIKDYNEAKEALVHYLNNPKNGNTHPHSYRTMLLHELQGNHDKKKDLKYLSKHFTSSLTSLASVLEVQLFANKFGK